MTVSVDAHKLMIRCRDHLLAALIAEADKRGQAVDMEWVENEQRAVTDAANAFAVQNGIFRRVTLEEVQRVERCAVGHSDYGTKFTLYVAELIVFGHTYGARP